MSIVFVTKTDVSGILRIYIMDIKWHFCQHWIKTFYCFLWLPVCHTLHRNIRKAILAQSKGPSGSASCPWAVAKKACLGVSRRTRKINSDSSSEYISSLQLPVTQELPALLSQCVF